MTVDAPTRTPKLTFIAPSGPYERAAFELGRTALAARFEVDAHLPRGAFETGADEAPGYLAASLGERLSELRHALGSGATHILCARGGFGSMELLPALDLEAIRTSRACLVGLSDITALHLAWARAGVPSLHASMVTALGRHAEPRAETFDAIGGERHTLHELDCLASGRAEGRLVGGNLSVIANLAGSPHMPDLRGAVLFLEDIGERAYRVHRLLLSLQLRGVFDEVAGVLLGQFTDCFESRGVSTDAMLRTFFEGFRVPVFAGAPCGHGRENTPLHLGHDVVLEANSMFYP